MVLCSRKNSVNSVAAPDGAGLRTSLPSPPPSSNTVGSTRSGCRLHARARGRHPARGGVPRGLTLPPLPKPPGHGLETPHFPWLSRLGWETALAAAPTSTVRRHPEQPPCQPLESYLEPSSGFDSDKKLLKKSLGSVRAKVNSGGKENVHSKTTGRCASKNAPGSSGERLSRELTSRA